MSQSDQSSQSLLFIRATVLSAILLGIVASLTGASAGQDKNLGVKTAVVNPRKLVFEYKFAASSRESIKKMEEIAKATLTILSQYPLLETGDQDALAKLTVKEEAVTPALTKPEADQMQALKDKHKNLVKELQTLQGKPSADISEIDSKQMGSLIKRQRDTQIKGEGFNKAKSEEIQGKQDEFNAKVDKDIRDALNKFCKDKGYNLVFSNEVVLFADTDITDDVLKKLNSN